MFNKNVSKAKIVAWQKQAGKLFRYSWDPNQNEIEISSDTLQLSQHFFQDNLRRLGVKLDLGTYLIKPVQRITKYHLVLKEILKYASKQKRDTGAIERALAVMIELPAKANNLMQIDSIVECPVSYKK